jgi:hypothetical protein
MGRLAVILATLALVIGQARSARADDGVAVSNDGQTLLVTFAEGLHTAHYGEAMYWTLSGRDFSLNDEPIRSASLVCVDGYTYELDAYCRALEVRLGDPLLASGATYLVKLGDREIGSFVARLGPPAPTPRVLEATATAHSITVRFSEPMLSDADCGSASPLGGRTGVIQWVRGPDEPFLFAIGHGGYRGGDDQLDGALLLAPSGSTNDDCSEISFSSMFGFPPGDHDFLVTGIRSADGLSALPDTWLTLSIPGGDPPNLLGAGIVLNTHDVQRIRLTFSAPLDPATVLDWSPYRLNGRPLPVGTAVSCEVPTCAWVSLDVPGDAFAYGSRNVVEVEGLRDLAGTAMPRTSSNEFTSYRY